VYESTLGSEIYISQKIIQASEKYKVDDFQHPLFTEKKNKVDEVFSTDAEQFKNKINNING
jgi:ribosomal protein L31